MEIAQHVKLTTVREFKISLQEHFNEMKWIKQYLFSPSMGGLVARKEKKLIVNDI